MKYGINTYGVLKDRRDTLTALSELRALGFTQLEPCLSPETIQGWEHVFWSPEWLLTHLSELRAHGWEIVSVHLIGWDADARAEELAALAAELGIRQFVVKCPQNPDERSLHETSMRYIRLADALNEAGAELLLHNEGTDLAARFRGKSAYERLLELCLGKVGAQFDTGWALADGEDPETLLWRLGPAVRSLHYKDMSVSGGAITPADLGKGDLNVLACLQFARAHGIPQILDQDEFAEGPAESLRSGLELLSMCGQQREPSASFLNILDTRTGEIRTLARFDRVIEAPNWMKTQNCLVYNSEGRIWKYDLAAGSKTLLDTGECDNCNNDHVLAPDERHIAVSHGPREGGYSSRVYIIPIEGGEARLVTPDSPSYLHGWSPDGRELAYCAFRLHDGRLETDVYSIPAEGGEEKRLTFGGFNDGPEYAPDGKSIWFNSTRSGKMQIWRMGRDGSDPVRMTPGERNNWFAHVSPDGEKVVYISYGAEDLLPNEHLPNMRVELRIMNADGSGDRRLLSFFGGQGSMNVNSWAPDSRHIAFVSYEILHK